MEEKSSPLSTISVIFVILAFLGGLGIGYFIFQPAQKKTTQQTSSALTNPTPVKGGSSINLPFSPSDSIAPIGIPYKLQGKVWRFKKEASGYQLIIEGNKGNINSDKPFSVDDKTSVSTFGKQDTLALTDIKVGDKIVVSYYFDLNKNDGYVTKLELTK